MMNIKKKSGIYKITNIVNDKVYVGSAVNIDYRFKTHKRLLKGNKHFNNHLQSSYNKNGKDNFRFEIVELVNEDTLLERETFWISYLMANNPDYGYNKRLIVNSNLGIKLSDVTRKKLSESHLGHKRTDEANKKIIESQYKIICQFDTQGKYIRSFSSLQEAACFLNVKYTTSITACLKKRLPSALGYAWCYEDEKETFKPEPLKRTTTKKIKIKVTCILTEKITIFESINDASKNLKISWNMINKAFEKKQYKNLIWEKI